MAILTRTDLLAAYADNSTQAIKAQQHRDFVDSVMVYGNLSVENDSMAVTSTPTKIPFNASIFSYGMTADTTNSEFDNPSPGHYRITVDFDADLTGNNVLYTFNIYADGASIGSGFTWNTQDSNRLTKTFIFPGVISVTSVVDIRVSTTGTQIMTINNIDWIMERMGSA